MDAKAALDLVWLEAQKSSLSAVADDMGVHRSALSRWKSGEAPTGRLKAKLITWAEAKAAAAYVYPEPGPPLQTRDGDAGTIGKVVHEAQAQTRANLVRLSEISGYAKAVLTMMQAVTEAQARVVESLAPYVEAEEQMQLEPLDPDVAAQITADMIASAMARAATEGKKPKGRAAG